MVKYALLIDWNQACVRYDIHSYMIGVNARLRSEFPMDMLMAYVSGHPEVYIEIIIPYRENMERLSKQI